MTAITRDNIDKLLDSRQLYVACANGRWYCARRNGATQKWKRDATRIAVPFKYGFKGYGKIIETDFLVDGTLPGNYYRTKDDVPANLRP